LSEGQGFIRSILDDVRRDHEIRELLETILRQLENQMASISDLSTDVAALSAAVAKLPAPGVTSINAADQASLDQAAADVQTATAAVTALEPAPAPAA
jgi:outer membrane murein-binding lipoprotein Lpp